MKALIKRFGAFAAVFMLTLSAGCAGVTDSESSFENNNSSERAPYSEISENSSQTEESSSENSESSAPETPVIKENWRELSQAEITAAMGMGWNLGNQLEALNGNTPSETAWGNPVITEQLIKLVKEQGFNTVRIPVSYLTHIGAAPDYTIDKEWLERVREVVDYVIGNDMFAVINMHGDGYYTINGAWLLCAEPSDKQAEIKEKYEAVWRQIAERFKDYDERLIFESMNEEFDGQYGAPNAEAYSNINDYNRIFTDAVRKTGSNNARRWLLIPGWNTNIEYTAGGFGFEIPDDTLCEADGNRLMISVHYYDPYNFTLNEDMNSAKTQWGKYGVYNVETSCGEEYVKSSMRRLRDRFVSAGYPVVIGEMGVQDKSQNDPDHNEFRRYWLETVVSAAKNNGCVPVYWDNGCILDKGFGLIDRNSLTVTQPELIAAMMRAVNTDGEYEIAAPNGS